MKFINCWAMTLLMFAELLAQSIPSKASDHFQNIKMIVSTGSRGEETEVTLSFESDRLLIPSRQGGGDLKAFPYSQIKSAEYSYSKSPRWKSGTGIAIAAGVFAIPIFFMKGKKHWLTIQGEGDYALLRLDKNNYKVILPAFEARSGRKVETAGEDR